MGARCKTFNESADGYMRGDGCSGLTLKYGDLPEERDAIWRASRVGQNGRSATLTAPNGLAQEEVITKASRRLDVARPPKLAPDRPRIGPASARYRASIGPPTSTQHRPSTGPT